MNIFVKKNCDSLFRIVISFSQNSRARGNEKNSYSCRQLSQKFTSLEKKTIFIFDAKRFHHWGFMDEEKKSLKVEESLN